MMNKLLEKLFVTEDYYTYLKQMIRLKDLPVSEMDAINDTFDAMDATWAKLNFVERSLVNGLSRKDNEHSWSNLS